MQDLLIALWRQAFELGVEDAAEEIGVPPSQPFGLDALLEAEGPGWLAQILSVDTPIAGRAEMITLTEITRAYNAGILAMYRQNGITKFQWKTTGPDPCELCIANAAAEPRFYGTPWPSGAVDPPQHPRCECVLTGVS